MIRDSKQLQIGKAGEYLACADLIIKGFIAFPSEQGLPYDLLLDTGSKLLKVQVKTTEKPRIVKQRANPIPAYIFSIKRAGADGKTRYSENEIDLFALVCLNTMKVGYVKNSEMPTTINIRVDEFKGTYYDEKGLEDYMIVRGLLDDGHSQTHISKVAKLNLSTVGRMLKHGYEPHKTKAKYFSDLVRDKNWFNDTF